MLTEAWKGDRRRMNEAPTTETVCLQKKKSPQNLITYQYFRCLSLLLANADTSLAVKMNNRYFKWISEVFELRSLLLLRNQMRWSDLSNWYKNAGSASGKMAPSASNQICSKLEIFHKHKDKYTNIQIYKYTNTKTNTLKGSTQCKQSNWIES